MTCKVMVKNQIVEEVRGKHGANAGKTFSIPKHNAYALISGERNPVAFQFGMPRPQSEDEAIGYEPGNYVVAAASFYVDDSKRLCLRNHLVLTRPDRAEGLLLKVTVHGTKVWKDPKDGTLHTMQDCDVHLPDEDYPVAALIPVRGDGVMPGEYFVGPESFVVQRRELDIVPAVQLLPLAASMKKAA